MGVSSKGEPQTNEWPTGCFSYTLRRVGGGGWGGDTKTRGAQFLGGLATFSCTQNPIIEICLDILQHAAEVFSLFVYMFHRNMQNMI